MEKRKYADRREELIRAVAKRRRKIKTMSIAYKGGKCQVCGYSKFPGALDLHHLDPKQKLFSIGDKGYTRSWERVQAELDKCILVCANCHRELEGGVTQLPGVIQVEERGEFGEAFTGNPEPSPENSQGEGVETIPQGSTFQS
jgi:hypothetical protein